MAKMIPSETTRSDFHGSYGEELVYESLKKLPDIYYVFHSVYWHRKDNRAVKWGESDFAVFHPRRGIIVVEVKSGGIEHSDGRWTQINTNNGERYRMKDPMVQAGRSKFTFIDLITERDENNRPYWVEAAVWFPSIERVDCNTALPPAYSNENVLFTKDLSNPKRSIESIFDYYGMNEKPYYTEDDATTIIKILSPQFEAVPSFSLAIAEQKSIFSRLTQEQSYLLDYLDEQRVAAIQGGAGTGKTMLAIEKAKRFPVDENVLFLCFNKMLLEHLQMNYGEQMPNVHFDNLPSLVCRQKRVSDYGGNDGITEYLNKYDDYTWPYKHIVIDEGQDFFDDHLNILSAIAEIYDGSFYVFYDKNQLVQQRESLDWMKHTECKLVLTANCRNTKSIAQTSCKPIGIDAVKMRTDITGNKPAFHILESEEQAVARIGDIIKTHTANGVQKANIVLLTVKTEGESILSHTPSVGSYHLISTAREKGILFTSARKYKGLESDVVILVDVDSETFSNEESKRVFYVGSSRAKHHLDIVSVLDESRIAELTRNLIGQSSKNSKLSLGSHLKVKIVT